MNISEAFKKAIKSYWEGDEYDESQSFKDKKYNKKYFDGVKSETLGIKEEPEDKKKKGKY